jgi:hypothetical protein
MCSGETDQVLSIANFSSCSGLSEVKRLDGRCPTAVNAPDALVGQVVSR